MAYFGGFLFAPIKHPYISSGSSISYWDIVMKKLPRPLWHDTLKGMTGQQQAPSFPTATDDLPQPRFMRSHSRSLY